MKLLIYAGIGLLGVAGIYGAADYYNSNKKGSIDNMYVEEPAMVNEKATHTEVVVKKDEAAAVSKATNSTTAATKPTVAKKKAVKIKRKKKEEKIFIRDISLSDFSRGRIVKRPLKVKPVQEEAVPASGPDEEKKED
jgi:hypothetical protein